MVPRPACRRLQTIVRRLAKAFWQSSSTRHFRSWQVQVQTVPLNYTPRHSSLALCSPFYLHRFRTLWNLSQFHLFILSRLYMFLLRSTRTPFYYDTLFSFVSPRGLRTLDEDRLFVPLSSYILHILIYLTHSGNWSNDDSGYQTTYGVIIKVAMRYCKPDYRHRDY